MSQNTAVRVVTVVNPQGLHARPANLLAQLASRFQSDIEVAKDGERVDAKSILSLLTLAAVQGTELSIRATGEDADEAVRALAAMFHQDFTDPQLSQSPENQREGSL